MCALKVDNANDETGEHALTKIHRITNIALENNDSVKKGNDESRD